MAMPEIVKSKRGGKRPGAGRPKGIPYAESRPGANRNKSLRERYPVWPLEHMLSVLNQPDVIVPKKNGKNGKEIENLEELKVQAEKVAAAKMDAAKAAAPYLHPRLAQVDINSTNRQVKHSLDLSKMTDEELAFFERIVAKTQVVVLDNETGEEVPAADYEGQAYGDALG